MRRLWMLTLVFALISLACDFSVPDIALPEFDLSQLNFSNAEVITGAGDVVDEKRAISNYSEVTLAGIGNLVIEEAETEGLVIHAEENLIQYIRAEVNQNRLVIGVQPGITLQPSKPITYRVRVKKIEGIHLTGSGSIEANGLNARKLTVDMGGSGHIKILKLDANGVTTQLTGSGDVELAGDVEEQALTISGAGAYKAPKLHSGIAKVKISGSGSAIVMVTNRLDIDISGSGAVHYKGDPEVNQNISGSGQVVKDE
jgi:hypothetical protein